MQSTHRIEIGLVVVHPQAGWGNPQACYLLALVRSIMARICLRAPAGRRSG
jgi:hypothetical protein